MRENLERVRERIARAAQGCGRDAGEVRIMAVTKTHPVETVRAAWQAGVRLFGENRIQEAEGKYAPLLRASADEGGLDGGLSLHLIGHLQRNKARAAASLFGCVQSIDKVETAEALERHCGEAGRVMDVLLELNTSGEESKFGCGSEGELRGVLERILPLEHLRVRGLMTVGPFTEDQGRIRSAFARLAALYARLREEYPQLSLDTLSMGMSGDFEAAVQEGATMVRLGTVLFGPRGT
ncbi:MAG: YggS family pyridoxal phosphate-dependent enzyme [Spirochaetales bacterium]|nr:YggS family pyridoxal phosphate-dependent enzyme [Spirochaetales bacterium]